MWCQCVKLDKYSTVVLCVFTKEKRKNDGCIAGAGVLVLHY